VSGIKAGAVNWPPLVVSKFLRIPFASLLTTTVAPGTAEPEPSWTTPEILPRPAPDCAKTLVARLRANPKTKILLLIVKSPRRENLNGFIEHRYL
jgi:prolyl-tRNA editing enzyme YbaK/EbsC (Cys-tRNA(Pro) deacylase)